MSDIIITGEQTDNAVSVSRSVPIQPGRQTAANSISVVLASDQASLNVQDATSVVSDVKSSMFGFPITEQRQFLLQELPNYGIDSSVWESTGTFAYDPNRSCVQLTLATNDFSTHQTKFAYKYQPGKQISVSQAIQCAIGPAIHNCFVQWGEFTKFDGYGWRVLTKRGDATGNLRIWRNYLLFFRRTSAVPPGTASNQLKRDFYELGNTSEGVQVGNSLMFRPGYLVGNGSDTDYIGSNTWEEIAYTSMVGSNFNRDKYTGRNQEGSPQIDGTAGNSAKQISFITDSYEIASCTGTNNSSTITFPSVNPVSSTSAPLVIGMTVRGTNIPADTRITAVTITSGNITAITINQAITGGALNGTIYINERSNLCMFLIQRSWYGGSGGKGLAYIPDRNVPFNGATRWVTGHEIRVGDTLPVPSMSNPDMPVTYLYGKQINSSNSFQSDFSLGGFTSSTIPGILRRFGVSIWIDGGDPRPAIVKTGSATGVSIANTNYLPMLAIVMRPYIWNNDISQSRPQKSRAYPYKLYISSTQNTEFYLVKAAGSWLNSYLTLEGSNILTAQNAAVSLDAVAIINPPYWNSSTITALNGYPSVTGATKVIGAFYCGANEGTEFDLTEIFDPQRELLGRAEGVANNVPGDILLVIARSLSTSSTVASCSLVFGVQ